METNRPHTTVPFVDQRFTKQVFPKQAAVNPIITTVPFVDGRFTKQVFPKQAAAKPIIQGGTASDIAAYEARDDVAEGQAEVQAEVHNAEVHNAESQMVMQAMLNEVDAEYDVVESFEADERGTKRDKDRSPAAASPSTAAPKRQKGNVITEQPMSSERTGTSAQIEPAVYGDQEPQ